MGHETMMAVAPWLRDAAGAVIAALRRPPGEPIQLVTEQHLQLPEVDEVLEARAVFTREIFGWDEEDCLLELHQLAHHIQCAVNFVLAGRKAFWVAPELVELLSQTTLDISGDLLRLPFPACAFIFRDEATRELAGRIAGRVRQDGLGFEVVTAYVYPIPEEYDEPGVRFCVLFDAFDGEWPFLLQRDIPTTAARSIEEILASHPEDSDDPFFREPEVAELVHLLINAVLYTTSHAFRSEERAPPEPRGESTDLLTGETVFYLPGKIQIRHDTAPDGRADRKSPERVITKRFWVRGHWRRPNPSWEDQRLRWIAPYLKGPEMAVVVERAYAVGGKAPAD